MSDDAVDRAPALVERLFALLLDCRTIARELDPGREREASPSAEAERLLYYALAGAMEEASCRRPSTSWPYCSRRASRLGRWARRG